MRIQLSFYLKLSGGKTMPLFEHQACQLFQNRTGYFMNTMKVNDDTLALVFTFTVNTELP